MKIAEIRLLSTDELKVKLQDARQELMNLRFQIVMGQQSDTSRLKVARRSIAQFVTILHERTMAETVETVEGEK
jgi:large subunit ribosomal protein L29